MKGRKNSILNGFELSTYYGAFNQTKVYFVVFLKNRFTFHLLQFKLQREAN